MFISSKHFGYRIHSVTSCWQLKTETNNYWKIKTNLILDFLRNVICVFYFISKCFTKCVSLSNMRIKLNYSNGEKLIKLFFSQQRFNMQFVPTLPNPLQQWKQPNMAFSRITNFKLCTYPIVSSVRIKMKLLVVD